MSSGRPSSSFYPLLSVVQLLTRGYSGLDARRTLAIDARQGIYDLLTKSPDARTEVIQLCLSTEMVITLLEERNDNDRSARFVDLFAWMTVLEIDAFLAWYLRSGRYIAFFRRWLFIRGKVASFQRRVEAAREMLQTANSLARSWLPRREDPTPTDPSDPRRRVDSQTPLFSGPDIDHRGPTVYVTQVVGDRNETGNCHWYQ